MKKRLSFYPKQEELLNVYSHGIGAILACIATLFLIMKSFSFQGIKASSFWVYGFSQILLFSISSIYHFQKKEKRRYLFNILDHSAIYVSIAGTYTPFCLVALSSQLGVFLFYLVWIIAIAGVSLKVFFTGKFNIISTLLYLGMGWLIIFYWNDLQLYSNPESLDWLIYGGVFYSIGAILYLIKKIPYNHAIFHFFVLAGAICHFISIYFYVE